MKTPGRAWFWRAPLGLGLAAALLCVACDGGRPGAVPGDPGPPGLRDSAIEFAQRFLETLDAEDLSATWPMASAHLQQRVGRADWFATLRASRAGVGQLVSRDLGRFGYTEELAEAPAGQYFVFDFDAVFANTAAVERVVCVLEKGVAWRTSGYFFTRK